MNIQPLLQSALKSLRSLNKLLALTAFLVAQTALAATQTGPNFVVNSLADTDDGSCDILGQGTGNHDCTLREALNAVSAYGNGATVTFSVSGTILLGSTLPEVNRNVTVDGSNQAVVLDGNNSVQIIQLYTRYFSGSYIATNFNALTFTRGVPAFRGSFADANISNCTFDSNPGGAVYMSNQSYQVPVYLTNCTFYNNNSTTGVVFANNIAATNCTFYGNNATFSGNPGAMTATGPSTIRNSIFASSPNGLNCSGGNFDASNISDDGSCGSATRATLAQIKLDTLKNNGGPSKTMALLAGSVAIGSGNSTIAGASPVNNLDQRGYGRISSSDPTSDVGAYEYNTAGPLASTPSISPSAGSHENAVQVSFSNSTAGSSFYYTIDGTTPNPGGYTTRLYSGPFLLSQNATVRVSAAAAGYANSPVAMKTYTIVAPLDFWRNLQSLPTNGSQDLANPSGDGVVNLQKFAFNLAPNAGDLSRPNVQTLPPNGSAGLPRPGYDGNGRLTVDFVRRKSNTTPGVSYVVETGSNLVNWASLDLSNATATSIDNTWERVSVTDPVVSSKRFGRVRLVTTPFYQSTFDYYPILTTLYGSAVVINEQSIYGAIKLTDGATGGSGWMILDGPTVGSYSRGFRALFTIALGPTSSATPADGASFAVGDLPTSGWSEGGPNTTHNIAIGFDTFENGGNGSTGMHLWVNGTHVAYNATNPYTNGNTVQVEVNYDFSSGLTMKFNGVTIFNNVPITGFNFLASDKFGFGARTGGFFENAVIDNVQIYPR